jgi:hypothetical protein
VRVRSVEGRRGVLELLLGPEDLVISLARAFVEHHERDRADDRKEEQLAATVAALLAAHDLARVPEVLGSGAQLTLELVLIAPRGALPARQALTPCARARSPPGRCRGSGSSTNRCT